MRVFLEKKGIDSPPYCRVIPFILQKKSLKTIVFVIGILYQVIQRKIGIAWTLTGFQNLGHSKRQQANQVNVVRVQ